MIKVIRSKYPEYADLTDEELANALHKKYYSDLDREEFLAKVMPKIEEIKEEVKESLTETIDEIIEEPAKEEPEERQNIDTYHADMLETIQDKTDNIVRAIANIRPAKVDTTSIVNAVKMVAMAIEPPDLKGIEKALLKVAESNKEMCEMMKPQPQTPWTFTINRDFYGKMDTVRAEPD